MRKRTRYPDEGYTDYGESAVLRIGDTHKIFGLNINRNHSFSSEWFDVDIMMGDDYERGINAQCHKFSTHSNINQMVYTFEDYDEEDYFYDVNDWDISELREIIFRIDDEV